MAQVLLLQKPSIIETQDIIYVDYSITSTFRTCQEKARLAYVDHWQSKKSPLYFDFGGAWHEGLAKLYEAKGRGVTNPDELLLAAKTGFLDETKKRGGSLPVSIDQEERRSVERGLNMLEAYMQRWSGEPFENLMYPDSQTGEMKPYVEIGFALFLFEWRGKPVMFVGRLDRIMRSRITGKPVIFESKSTTQGLTNYIRQVKPNHQITGYHWMAAELIGLDVRETIWDCAFVSTRKPASTGRWYMLGIDIENDFARQPTTRTVDDINEFLYDLTMTVHEYLTLIDMNLRRWTRNAPTACHQFGGCIYRNVCASNLNENILKTDFMVERWEPWRGITVPK